MSAHVERTEYGPVYQLVEGDRVAYTMGNGEIYGTVRAVGGCTVRVEWEVPGHAPPLVLLSNARLVSLAPPRSVVAG